MTLIINRHTDNIMSTFVTNIDNFVTNRSRYLIGIPFRKFPFRHAGTIIGHNRRTIISLINVSRRDGNVSLLFILSSISHICSNSICHFRFPAGKVPAGISGNIRRCRGRIIGRNFFVNHITVFTCSSQFAIFTGCISYRKNVLFHRESNNIIRAFIINSNALTIFCRVYQRVSIRQLDISLTNCSSSSLSDTILAESNRFNRLAIQRKPNCYRPLTSLPNGIQSDVLVQNNCVTLRIFRLSSIRICGPAQERIPRTIHSASAFNGNFRPLRILFGQWGITIVLTHKRICVVVQPDFFLISYNAINIIISLILILYNVPDHFLGVWVKSSALFLKRLLNLLSRRLRIQVVRYRNSCCIKDKFTLFYSIRNFNTRCIQRG